EITDMLVRSNAVDVIIVDSVAALVPKAEIEGEMGDAHVGLQARLMSQALRKITGNIKNANCLVIFINQIRMKIGVMFGNPETTTGGNALKFYASVRLDIRRTGAVKEGDETVTLEKGKRSVTIQTGSDSLDVKDTRTVTVGADQTHSTGGNYSHKVSGDFELTVDGNLTIKVSGTLALQSGGSLTLKSDADLAAQAGTSLTSKAGTSLTNQAGTSLTNKAGAEQTVDGGGMLTIKGGLVKVN
ncbi:MAG: hypothetical protein E7E29_23440, partial [Pseudomonas aeruginosa]|nr:hypothetical protein [Pseudomonas aeruginosa]